VPTTGKPTFSAPVISRASVHQFRALACRKRRMANAHAPDIVSWLLGAAVVVAGVIVPILLMHVRSRNLAALRRD